MTAILCRRFVCGLAGSLVMSLAFATSPATASTYPDRAVRLVLPFGAGGSTDTIARVLAERLSTVFSQPFVVENRPGAAGAIASEQVARSAPDGHTLLLATTSTHAVLPHLKSKLPYDAQRDFVAVGRIARAANVLMVSPQLPVKSVAEFVEYAKTANPPLSFASSGNGTVTHLIGEMFVAAAGLSATHVPYRTGVQALPDIAGGQIAFMMDSIVWAMPQAKAGKVRPLAVTSPLRSALAPELPTVAESGLPGFDGVTWFGLMAPAGTPPAVIARLGVEIERALASKDLSTRLLAVGVEPSWQGAEAFGAFVSEDSRKWGELIRRIGVKIE